MRVLFLGDLAPTGFGSVTTDLGRELLRVGLDVRFISQNDTGSDLPEPFASRTLSMPSLVNVVNTLTGEAGSSGANPIGNLFSTATKAELVNGQPWGEWLPEAVIVLGDIEAATYIISSTADLSSVPLYHYVPIEGRGLSPSLADDLWAVAQPVAMSTFGADEIEKVTGVRPPMIYHGVDTNVFHPIKPSRPVTLTNEGAPPMRVTTRTLCKDMWSGFFGTVLPKVKTDAGPVHSDKWMLRTDRHMPRKLYNAMLRALTPVLGKNAEAVLVLHCGIKDGGGDLSRTIAKLPGAKRLSGGDKDRGPEGWALFERPYAQILLTNSPGLSREALTTLYNAADLYVSASAEGFGLTIAEALACGIPAVGLDYSAVPEVIGPAGRLVPAHEFDNPYDHFWAAPNEQRLAETVDALLNDRAERETLGRKGPRHIYHSFRWDTAARQFADLLTQARTPVEVAA